jgi:tetratricopeptide (TPR) repeat protein
MKTQLDKLETLCSKSTSAEARLIKGLLDEAIKLYRQGKFKEAISKWEEALARDPGKLEAKFNIEIAKDRIKEKEIHEELKSLLIQRK